MRHVVLFDEIAKLLPGSQRMDIGETVVQDIFRRGRKREIAAIAADQLPGTLANSIIGNLAVRILLRSVDPRSNWVMANSMSLTPEQAAMLPELQPRQAIVQYSACPKPFLAEIVELRAVARPSDADIRRRAEEALAGVPWSPGTSGDTSREGMPPTAAGPAQLGELSGDALKVLLDICSHSERTIEEHAEEVGIDRSREFRARQMLLDRGLIEKAGQSMGKLVFYQVTAKGEEWAQQRRVHVKKYKSGPVHEAILTKVQHALGKALPGARFRRGSTIGSEAARQPDLALTTDGGRVILVEVCCHNVTRQADTLREEAAIQLTDMVIAVTPSVELRRKLQQELDKKAKDKEPRLFVKGTVTVISAPDCLEPDFDWVGLLSRP